MGFGEERRISAGQAIKIIDFLPSAIVPSGQRS